MAGASFPQAPTWADTTRYLHVSIHRSYRTLRQLLQLPPGQPGDARGAPAGRFRTKRGGGALQRQSSSHKFPTCLLPLSRLWAQSFPKLCGTILRPQHFYSYFYAEFWATWSALLHELTRSISSLFTLQSWISLLLTVTNVQQTVVDRLHVHVHLEALLLHLLMNQKAKRSQKLGNALFLLLVLLQLTRLRLVVITLLLVFTLIEMTTPHCSSREKRLTMFKACPMNQLFRDMFPFSSLLSG